jgi:hypothetical protein
MKGAPLPRGEWPANGGVCGGQRGRRGETRAGRDRRRLSAPLRHQAANGEMSHHEPIEFLADEIRRLAAQHDSGAAQMGLKFVECGLDFPAFMVEGGQLRRRGFLVIEDSGDEPIDRLGIGDAIEAIVNHAHRHAVGLVSPISRRRVEVAEIKKPATRRALGHAPTAIVRGRSHQPYGTSGRLHARLYSMTRLGYSVKSREHRSLT